MSILTSHNATNDNKKSTLSVNRMFRRSISMNDAHKNIDIIFFKDLPLKSIETSQKRNLCRHLSYQQEQNLEYCDLEDTSSYIAAQNYSYGGRHFLTESEAHFIVTSVFEEAIDNFFRYLVLPVGLILCIIFVFFNLPVQPKAEIYRTLCVIFTMLLGLSVQGCLVTVWAARRFGLIDFLRFIRYYISDNSQHLVR